MSASIVHTIPTSNFIPSDVFGDVPADGDQHRCLPRHPGRVVHHQDQSRHPQTREEEDQPRHWGASGKMEQNSWLIAITYYNSYIFRSTWSTGGWGPLAWTTPVWRWTSSSRGRVSRGWMTSSSLFPLPRLCDMSRVHRVTCHVPASWHVTRDQSEQGRLAVILLIWNLPTAYIFCF